MFRRGKLAFLSTKDDRIKIVNDRINLTEKHLIEMCAAFAACTRKMAKYRDAYDELGQKAKNYAADEEINESLSEGMNSFTNAVTILGDYMDLQVHRVEMKIVNELAQFENLCKGTRDNLRVAVIARDKEVLKQRQMLEIKSKFSANNSAADSELLKAKLEVNRTNKEIDEIISNFEKRKLTDIKSILTDFILISIKYHTKALEALSASYYDISNIDEKSDFHEFQKLMKTKEEPQTRKAAMKKGLRSQSMESLDRDQLLSPIKRKNRLSRSNKNLAEKRADEEEEEDDDDGEEEDESEDNTNEEEENSGTASEDDITESVSEAKPTIAKSSGNAGAGGGGDATVKKVVKTKTQIKQPFKAVAATHIFKSNAQTKPFAAKSGIGIPAIKRSSIQFVTTAIDPEATAAAATIRNDNTYIVYVGGGGDGVGVRGSGSSNSRLVTKVVESKHYKLNAAAIDYTTINKGVIPLQSRNGTANLMD